jgi:hypothetical protein
LHGVSFSDVRGDRCKGSDRVVSGLGFPSISFA